ncbi:hypothetical protein CAPTEDRAFT_155191 [Capitella teleta]|uniref:G-protein coupled receptors family 2 profile 2 domain-containing protein n=1 Tax=Capitella teleta TaxID=283909 RepID=R7TAJ6_CAPTE|nr:hypothetical protein CAPTEDRAFT_155191 [Capitella teleta]|eukprot:ELT90748.1 hypothetical protein CAPTEDRAFT_155191 [Capitella teleta]
MRLRDLVGLMVVIGSVQGGRSLPSSRSSSMCNDRFGELDLVSFGHRSCSMCYYYLFPRMGKPLVPQQPHAERLIFTNKSLTVDPSPIVPDPNNLEAAERVCATLTSDECQRWKDCCVAAENCCIEQLQREVPSGERCQQVWDGFSCFDYAKPGSAMTTPCPTYLQYSMTGEGVKVCTANATWQLKKGKQWTDYTACLDKNAYLIGVYITVAVSSLSIALLVPAIIIFCSFKDLLKQHRVRLHIHFFASLTLSFVASILWYMLVHYEKLVNQNSTESVMYRNPGWCQLLSFAKIYLTATNYFWMFCEGYYLHRLISNAFEPPSSLFLLYVLGWGAPAIAVLVYSFMRIGMANTSCWAISFGHYEWIIYAPNLLCLFASVGFLCNILRILIFQLHSHPNEPSNFRRALKAAFMLIPLFGLQMFLTIYRPPVGVPGHREYEYVFYVNSSSQGIFVALIFCFFNGEVATQLKLRCPCFSKDRRNGNPVTTITMVENGRSPSLSSRSRTSCSQQSPKQANRLLVNGGANPNEVLLQEAKKKTSPGSSQGSSPISNKQGYSRIPPDMPSRIEA